MIKSFRTIVSLPLTMTLIGIVHSYAAASDNRAADVLAASSRTLIAIQSIEFRAERDLFMLPPKAKVPNAKLPDGWTGRAKDGYVFRSNGNEYRVDEFNENGAPTECYSFNGTTFQFFSEKLSAFRESKQRIGPEPLVPFPDPISLAYEWVYPTSAARSWDTLRSRQTWDDVVNRSRFINERKSGGATIAMIEIERLAASGQTFIYSVEFDKDHGSVPIAWSSYLLPDRKFSTSVLVKRWSDAAAGDAGYIRIPIDAEMKSAGASGMFHIIENSLRVNKLIDEDLFSIPRSRAQHIIRNPTDLQNSTPASTVAQLTVVLINVAVVGLVIVVLVLRRRAKARASHN
jgi:hypothetical protein